MIQAVQHDDDEEEDVGNETASSTSFRYLCRSPSSVAIDRSLEVVSAREVKRRIKSQAQKYAFQRVCSIVLEVSEDQSTSPDPMVSVKNLKIPAYVAIFTSKLCVWRL